ncbi:MAG: hypothetical protein AUK30_02565 [Nitrospirae bacterium CG2_30_70_394]|nr:MAG: hypothetical protein AUK30_02565 [Nitrospirae bacterium CG2_30_70_394]
MLQYIVRSHPRLSLPTGESHFIVPLYRERERFGDLARPENVRRVLEEMWRRNRSFLATDLHGVHFDEAAIPELAESLAAAGGGTMAGVIAALFGRNAAGEGKARWGDKTPYYVLHMALLLEMYPAAQFIHLIRDGRDCALSTLVRRDDFHVYNFYEAARYWQHYVEVGQEVGAHLPAGSYFEIRYEDLLDDPPATLGRLCCFLGEPYTDDLVNFRKAHEAGKTPLVAKPIQKDNQEKWRGAMSARQLRLFEGAAGATLARNGYPLATPGDGLAWPVRVACTLHNRVLRRWRRARKHG